LEGTCAVATCVAQRISRKVRKVKRGEEKGSLEKREEKLREGKKDVMRFFIAKVKFSLAEIQLKYKVVQR
jgi:hypothetical protein